MQACCLFGREIGMGEPGRADVNPEQSHDRLGGRHVAQPGQQSDELNRAELFDARRGQIASGVGGDEAQVERGREIVAASHRALPTQRQRGQQVLVRAPRHIEPAVLGTQAALIGHQIRVGELEACQRGDALRRGGQELRHG